MLSLARERLRGLLLLMRDSSTGQLTLVSLIIGSLGLPVLVGSVVALAIGRPSGFPLGVVLAMLLGVVALAVGWRWWRMAWRPYQS